METNKVKIKFCGIFDLEHCYIPEWMEEEQEMVPSFEYNNNRYFLDEFMDIHNKFYNPNPADFMKGFDGYMGTSYFDGYLIKIIENEAIKLYHYYS